VLWCHGDCASGLRTGWGASVHPVSVVGSVLVADEPGVGLGLELVKRGESAPVECWATAFLGHGLVEAFHHGVVVWGPSPVATVFDSELTKSVGEAFPDEFATVVGEERVDLVAAPTPAALHDVDELAGGGRDWDARR